MEKFIPYDKLSKKRQRELNARKRNMWSISPVTRKPPNPKAYDRKKAQKWRDDPVSVPLEMITEKAFRLDILTAAGEENGSEAKLAEIRDFAKKL